MVLHLNHLGNKDELLTKCKLALSFIFTYAFNFISVLLNTAVIIVWYHFVSAWRAPFTIAHMAGLLKMNFLTFCLSEKVLMAHSFFFVF